VFLTKYSPLISVRVNWKSKNVFLLRATRSHILRYLGSRTAYSCVRKNSTVIKVLNLIVIILFAFCCYEHERIVLNCVFNFKEDIQFLFLKATCGPPCVSNSFVWTACGFETPVYVSRLHPLTGPEGE